MLNDLPIIANLDKTHGWWNWQTSDDTRGHMVNSEVANNRFEVFFIGETRYFVLCYNFMTQSVRDR